MSEGKVIKIAEDPKLEDKSEKLKDEAGDS